MLQNAIRYAAALTVVGLLLSSCGLKRHKYDNPITKDTQQPDKVLFDKAIADVEHSRFEVARFTLQTLINTYDTSEYLAKAKLAIADSWFREGGAHGLAQAEAEYKDFILFYPAMEEAAEAQEKVCDIHYKQMEKSDRDPMHALRAEDESLRGEDTFNCRANLGRDGGILGLQIEGWDCSFCGRVHGVDVRNLQC